MSFPHPGKIKRAKRHKCDCSIIYPKYIIYTAPPIVKRLLAAFFVIIFLGLNRAFASLLPLLMPFAKYFASLILTPQRARDVQRAHGQGDGLRSGVGGGKAIVNRVRKLLVSARKFLVK